MFGKHLLRILCLFLLVHCSRGPYLDKDKIGDVINLLNNRLEQPLMVVCKACGILKGLKAFLSRNFSSRNSVRIANKKNSNALH